MIDESFLTNIICGGGFINTISPEKKLWFITPFLGGAVLLNIKGVCSHNYGGRYQYVNIPTCVNLPTCIGYVTIALPWKITQLHPQASHPRPWWLKRNLTRSHRTPPYLMGTTHGFCLIVVPSTNELNWMIRVTEWTRKSFSDVQCIQWLIDGTTELLHGTKQLPSTKLLTLELWAKLIFLDAQHSTGHDYKKAATP